MCAGKRNFRSGNRADVIEGEEKERGGGLGFTPKRGSSFQKILHNLWKIADIKYFLVIGNADSVNKRTQSPTNQGAQG